MFISKVDLSNIRSYTKESITFKKGINLLSGDIGAGKSSILLAIEFALFGIGKGLLSGTSLLRTGETEGSVTLECEIDNNTYTITRTLKKSKDKVTQTAGTITANGVEKKLTPVEMKAEIFNLLQYPMDELTKRSLIFRYTVYTPQEAMKQILFDDVEQRLGTLRKIFGIDKYKQIRENAKVVTKELRTQTREQKARSEDLTQKKESYKELQEKVQSLRKQEQELEQPIKRIEERI